MRNTLRIAPAFPDSSNIKTDHWDWFHENFVEFRSNRHRVIMGEWKKSSCSSKRFRFFMLEWTHWVLDDNMLLLLWNSHRISMSRLRDKLTLTFEMPTGLPWGNGTRYCTPQGWLLRSQTSLTSRPPIVPSVLKKLSNSCVLNHARAWLYTASNL